ncbi:hypothetical protein Tdes44962_MAKER04413 [Teratosphaeria destructans]|uniref:Uncharacterized protein n=1 Tax=Teratosphaeria destructans TaxID=418781 RepID=A0A9W7W0D2_9PEZI|nr:hypothetical protein Tdes44962_MAKER04413 [Teratosphaeria destructans]
MPFLGDVLRQSEHRLTSIKYGPGEFPDSLMLLSCELLYTPLSEANDVGISAMFIEDACADLEPGMHECSLRGASDGVHEDRPDRLVPSAAQEGYLAFQDDSGMAINRADDTMI